jgi:hypothetical protein
MISPIIFSSIISLLLFMWANLLILACYCVTALIYASKLGALGTAPYGVVLLLAVT